MALSKNINDREKNKFTSKRGTRVKTAPIPEDGNAIDVVVSTITTTATKIDLPDEARAVIIKHITGSTNLFIGDEDVTTSTGFPLQENETLELYVKPGNDNNIYGILSSGSISVYALGVVKQ